MCHPSTQEKTDAFQQQIATIQHESDIFLILKYLIFNWVGDKKRQKGFSFLSGNLKKKKGWKKRGQTRTFHQFLEGLPPLIPDFDGKSAARDANPPLFCFFSSFFFVATCGISMFSPWWKSKTKEGRRQHVWNASSSEGKKKEKPDTIGCGFLGFRFTDTQTHTVG